MSYRDQLIFIVVFASILLTGCKEHVYDERLEQIAVGLSENPESAIVALDSIDRSTLSNSDRHYYDFLTIKANDKAYVRHTSDSLYLSVLDYYNRHKKDPLYPEVLYYGGRLYSDLGDYPRALKYFQESLALLPDNDENTQLRLNLLSQNGRILMNLRFYSQAIPYFKECITKDIELNDSVNIPSDYKLLGMAYLQNKNYKEAEQTLKKAYDLTTHKTNDDVFRLKGEMSLLKFFQGEIDSALFLMRGVPENTHGEDREYFLSYATRIYYNAGIMDTAYNYAKEIKNSNHSTWSRSGYKILLSPEIKRLSPPDSIDLYLKNYLDVLEKIYNENDRQATIIQNSLYNYSLQQRDREKAEKEKAVVWDWLLGSIALILLLLVVILYYKYRDRKQQIQLHLAIDKVEKLRQSLKSAGTRNEDNSQIFLNPTQEAGLRERLRDELLRLYEENKEVTPNRILTNSAVYEQLSGYVKEDKVISEENTIWKELEEDIKKVSPYFKENLELLTGSRLTTHDYHTALLIKYGVPPSRMSILLGRSKSAIVSRRKTLSQKIFGKEMGMKVIDGIIRLL